MCVIIDAERFFTAYIRPHLSLTPSASSTILSSTMATKNNEEWDVVGLECVVCGEIGGDLETTATVSVMQCAGKDCTNAYCFECLNEYLEKEPLMKCNCGFNLGEIASEDSKLSGVVNSFARLKINEVRIEHDKTTDRLKEDLKKERDVKSVVDQAQNLFNKVSESVTANR